MADTDVSVALLPLLQTVWGSLGISARSHGLATLRATTALWRRAGDAEGGRGDSSVRVLAAASDLVHDCLSDYVASLRRRAKESGTAFGGVGPFPLDRLGNPLDVFGAPLGELGERIGRRTATAWKASAAMAVGGGGGGGGGAGAKRRGGAARRSVFAAPPTASPRISFDDHDGGGKTRGRSAAIGGGDEGGAERGRRRARERWAVRQLRSELSALAAALLVELRDYHRLDCEHELPLYVRTWWRCALAAAGLPAAGGRAKPAATAALIERLLSDAPTDTSGRKRGSAKTELKRVALDVEVQRAVDVVRGQAAATVRAGAARQLRRLRELAEHFEADAQQRRDRTMTEAMTSRRESLAFVDPNRCLRSGWLLKETSAWARSIGLGGGGGGGGGGGKTGGKLSLFHGGGGGLLGSGWEPRWVRLSSLRLAWGHTQGEQKKHAPISASTRIHITLVDGEQTMEISHEATKTSLRLRAAPEQLDGAADDAACGPNDGRFAWSERSIRKASAPSPVPAGKRRATTGAVYNASVGVGAKGGAAPLSASAPLTPRGGSGGAGAGGGGAADLGGWAIALQKAVEECRGATVMAGKLQKLPSWALRMVDLGGGAADNESIGWEERWVVLSPDCLYWGHDEKSIDHELNLEASTTVNLTDDGLMRVVSSGRTLMLRLPPELRGGGSSSEVSTRFAAVKTRLRGGGGGGGGGGGDEGDEGGEGGGLDATSINSWASAVEEQVQRLSPNARADRAGANALRKLATRVHGELDVEVLFCEAFALCFGGGSHSRGLHQALRLALVGLGNEILDAHGRRVLDSYDSLCAGSYLTLRPLGRLRAESLALLEKHAPPTEAVAADPTAATEHGGDTALLVDGRYVSLHEVEGPFDALPEVCARLVERFGRDQQQALAEALDVHFGNGSGWQAASSTMWVPTVAVDVMCQLAATIKMYLSMSSATGLDQWGSAAAAKARMGIVDPSRAETHLPFLGAVDTHVVDLTERLRKHATAEAATPTETSILALNAAAWVGGQLSQLAHQICDKLPAIGEASVGMMMSGADAAAAALGGDVGLGLGGGGGGGGGPGRGGGELHEAPPSPRRFSLAGGPLARARRACAELCCELARRLVQVEVYEHLLPQLADAQEGRLYAPIATLSAALEAVATHAARAHARPILLDVLGSAVEVLDASLTDRRKLAELRAARRVVRLPDPPDVETLRRSMADEGVAMPQPVVDVLLDADAAPCDISHHFGPDDRHGSGGSGGAGSLGVSRSSTSIDLADTSMRPTPRS